MYLFSLVLNLRCSVGFSLVEASGGYSVVAMHGLLIAVASLVVEHRLQGAWASVVVVPRLESTDSIVVVHGLVEFFWIGD